MSEDTSDEIRTALDNTYVIIPMLNEQDSIGLVLRDLPDVRRIVVVDNGSTDDGAKVAKAAGAHVIAEPQRGYGKACLTGIACVDKEVRDSTDGLDPDSVIVVFVDGDYSDHPDELPQLIQPIVNGEADFVVGSRATGEREQGAMHVQALFGNWLACTLMKIFWKANFTDLGPFRAIRYTSLKSLGMQDEDFGWTIEMQIKAMQRGVASTEVPISYRRRVGVSKISGTVSGTIKAGYKILFTIFRYRLSPQALGD